MSKLSKEGKPLVSIVSINYNQLAVTFEMLASIRQQHYQELEVIIVDNASEEDPTFAIQQKYPEVTVIRSTQNLGFSGGNNLGINAAKGDFIFLVNNDTELTEDLVETLVNRFQEVPDLGIGEPNDVGFIEGVHYNNNNIYDFETTNILLGIGCILLLILIVMNLMRFSYWLGNKNKNGNKSIKNEVYDQVNFKDDKQELV